MITITAFLAGTAIGAVASYLALRNNAKIRTRLDATTSAAERLVKH